MRQYEQKEDAICELITDRGEPLGTGFFCQTTIKNKTIKFLFTCNHVLDQSKIKIGSTIKLKHKEKTKKIKITKNRFVCTNEKLDYTCIEIYDDIKILINILKLILILIVIIHLKNIKMIHLL